MSLNRSIVIAVFASLIIIIGGGYLVAKAGPASLEAAVGAQAELTTTSHDWGKIGINDGKVQASFPIKNAGSALLKLNNIITSCACTSAYVVIDGVQSRLFGMHTKSAWIGELSPGDTAQLVVEFDPAFHGPSGLGAIDRQVTVNTNDPNNPQLTFNLKAEVI